MMKPYKYLLLDLDNTLFDFDRAEKAAFFAAFSASGIHADDSVYEKYHVINSALWKQLERGEVTKDQLKVLRFSRLFEACGIPSADGGYAMSCLYADLLAGQRFLLDGAKDVCQVLSTHYKLYGVTNGIGYIQRGRFFGSELEVYFSDLFISEELGAEKPSPIYFSQVIDRVGDEDLSRYCIIGDSLSSDIAGAGNVGIDAIWLDRAHTGDARGHAVSYILNDIRELPDYLLNN